jgi:hypothetical protein
MTMPSGLVVRRHPDRCGFVAGVLAGGIPSPRGIASGAINGLTSWAIIALAVATLILVATATGATTATLSLKTGNVAVGLIRPYVVFWAAVIGTGAAALGGVGGGLLPRRQVDVAYSDTDFTDALQPARPGRPRETAPLADQAALADDRPVVRDAEGRSIRTPESLLSERFRCSLWRYRDDVACRTRSRRG